MAHEFPVGKAQQQVLDALHLQAASFQDADRVLAEYGLSVGSRRVGRVSVPVVRRLAAEEGGWELDGYSGASVTLTYKAIDLAPIAQWLAQ